MSDIRNNKSVVFDTANHIYTRVETGERLFSVSQVISCYKNIFDESGELIKKCAVREGISVQELRARWDKKRDDACEYGTSVHAAIEDFIKTKEIKPGPHDDIVAEFAKIKFSGRLKSEVMLWDFDYGIAGTADIVEVLPDNTVSIYDIKTNEKLRDKSFFGKKPQMMLPPLRHLHDANLVHYALQLSSYSVILDRRGYWIKDISIFWVNRKSREIEVYKMEYRRNDVIRMLDHFKANRQKLISKIGLDINLNPE